MDQATRNKLRNVVTQCRKLLEESISQQLEGQFGIRAGKKNAVQIEDEARMTHLSDEDQAYRRDLLDHFNHIKARGFKDKEALDQLIREIAFTHLNRLCAYKMMEARDVYVGGQKFREAVSRGINSNGFKFYLADHPDDERLFNTGQQELAYRHFLDWLGGLLSEEIGVLFNPNDPANRLYPRQSTVDELLELLNDGELAGIWDQDETIGWVYQYFTPKELRDQARKESQAPRNSYELAFRNQFFTPRYVVEFLTDNTLGRIWYEMRKGDTKLKDQCRYMVRRPNEVFLDERQEPPETPEPQEDLSQEELLKQPVHIPHRPKKDPRELKILDPACGSGHFLLYCFDLLLTIYEEAYDDPDLGPPLLQDYGTLDDLRWDIPRLILAHNLHGIDIDLRCTQIAALALWLRCQRAYQQMGLKRDRPKITRSNLVCAEPMPGEEGLLEEFLKTLHEDRLPKLIRRVVDVPEDRPVRTTPEMADRLCELVRLVWDRMQLAGEAGSLLKIEEELQEAIRKGQEEWEEDQPLFRVTQYALSEEPQEKYVRFVPGEGVSFWERSEALVMAALDDFAEYAANGRKLLRKLFVDDAIRGFAFVDVCRQQFDVVLMNPPYGDPTARLKRYLRSAYRGQPHDAYACFIERFGGATLKGLFGALTSHTFLNYSSFANLREQILLPNVCLDVAADFGLGILDAAMVRTAAFTLRPKSRHSSLYLRLLDTDDKHATLRLFLNRVSNGDSAPHIHIADQGLFSLVPNSPFAYWLPESLLQRFTSKRTFDTETDSRLGLQTANNERYLRIWVEIPRASISRSAWAFYAKGGDFLKYYSPIYLVVDWRGDGQHILDEYGSSVRLRDIRQYYRPGVTYPLINEFGMNAAALPENCVFDNGSPTVFPKHGHDNAALLALLNSRIVQMLIRCQTSTRHWQVGYLRAVPFPALPDGNEKELAQLATSAAEFQRSRFVDDELCLDFVKPRVFFTSQSHLSLFETAKMAVAEDDSTILRMVELDYQIERAVNAAYDLSAREVDALDLNVGQHPALRPRDERMLDVQQENNDDNSDGSDNGCDDPTIERVHRITLAAPERVSAKRGVHPSLVAERRRRDDASVASEINDLIAQLPSYCVGCVFGRWDIRKVMSEQHECCKHGNPFDGLPSCSPGMLQTPEGRSAVTTPEGYPLRIDWDGILVDDAEHEDDIVRRIRETLEVMWPSKGEGIERELAHSLGGRRISKNFRRPGSGGFWDSHVKNYSRRPRKAPIYWLLQSSKKNYALWLYYHRLDKDMLFKALLNYVEPKIQREENRLAELRSQKSSAGESGKGAKKLDRDIEKQEDLLSELRDFEEKLRKVANMHLVPDLNDGVVLNIAPLHELVPWKEAKKYWNHLMDGKYEWSTIGKQLREKGLVR